MVLLAFEGFENMEPTGRYGLTYINPVGFVAGRTSGNAIRSTATGGMSAVLTFPDATTSVLTASCAFRLDVLTTTDVDVIRIANPSANRSHVGLRVLRNTGVLQVFTNGGTYSTSYTMSVGEWARLDLVANNADAPNGWAEAWVNGVKVYEGTGIDTRENNDAVVGSVMFSPGASNVTRGTIDDVYVLNNVGPAPYNARLGDVRVETLVPNGNGNTNQWVGSDGNSVDNWALVDELPASTTDYVTGAAGDKDLYNFTNLSVGAGQVLAVQQHISAMKTSAGAAELIPVMRVAGVESEGTPVGLGQAAAYSQSQIHTVDPSYAGWTVGKVNAAEFGVKGA